MSISNADYRFKGLPLTPNVAETLIRELFPGQTVERNRIVDAVVQLHQSRGGVNSRAADTTATIKKALQGLKSSALAANPSAGFWQIAAPVAQPQGEPLSESGDSISDVPQYTPIAAPVLSPQKTIGEGASAVYVYYFQTYRAYATINKETRWPCKIGRSDRDPMLRVLSQASTALPETPIVGLLIRSDDASSMEAALHAILTLRGQRHANAPGDEWFDTTPDEVIQILHSILPDFPASDIVPP